MLLILAALSMLTGIQSEVAFVGASDLNLSGTYLSPVGDGPFACVLLLPGSGPTDRDGNQPPYLTTNVLKQIAERLQADGIASFRFDKRPVHVNKDQWPKDKALWSDYFSFDNHAADIEAAFNAMKAQKPVEPAKLAILGHSEGGLFTCWEAERLKPKALVLVGAVGEPMTGTLRYQIERNVSKAPISEEEKKKIIDSNEESMAMIVKDGTIPETVHPGLKMLYNPVSLSLIRSYLTIDPTVPLKRYTGSVLVMNGELDIQVRAKHDAVLLSDALKSRTTGTHELYIVPLASHCLKHVDTEDEPGFEGPIVPVALEKISSWLKLNLKP